MSMFLDSSRTLPDIKEGLGNPDMSGILLDSPTLLLSWPYKYMTMQHRHAGQAGMSQTHRRRTKLCIDDGAHPSSFLGDPVDPVPRSVSARQRARITLIAVAYAPYIARSISCTSCSCQLSSVVPARPMAGGWSHLRPIACHTPGHTWKKGALHTPSSLDLTHAPREPKAPVLRRRRLPCCAAGCNAVVP